MINVHAGAFATGLGRKVKYTEHGFIPVQHPKVATLGPDLVALHNIKKSTLGDSIRVLFTGNMEGVCGRDAQN